MLRLPAHKSPKLSDASVGRTAGSLLIAPRDVTRHLHRRLMPVNRQQCQAVARPSSSGSGGNSGGCSSAAGLSWCNLTTTLRGRIAARAGFGFGKAKSSPGGKKQPGGGDTGGAKDCPCGSGALYTVGGVELRCAAADASAGSNLLKNRITHNCMTKQAFNCLISFSPVLYWFFVLGLCQSSCARILLALAPPRPPTVLLLLRVCVY